MPRTCDSYAIMCSAPLSDDPRLSDNLGAILATYSVYTRNPLSHNVRDSGQPEHVVPYRDKSISKSVSRGPF